MALSTLRKCILTAIECYKNGWLSSVRQFGWSAPPGWQSRHLNTWCSVVALRVEWGCGLPWRNMSLSLPPMWLCDVSPQSSAASSCHHARLPDCCCSDIDGLSPPGTKPPNKTFLCKSPGSRRFSTVIAKLPWYYVKGYWHSWMPIVKAILFDHTRERGNT